MSSRFSRSTRTTATLALVGLGVGVLAACGSDDEDTEAAPGEPTTLSAGYIPGASLAPAFIAEELGCYAEQDLTVEFEPIANPADAIALLSSGQLDAYVGAPSAGMFNQVARGADLKLVASLGSINTPGDEPAASGLYGGNHIDRVEQLEGKRVGILGSVGTATSYLVGRSLAEGGLTFSDVELVSMSLADMVPALANGGVDAALLVAPETKKALDQGIAHALVDSREAYGEDTTSAVMYGSSLLEDDRDAGVRMLAAISCAAERMQGDWRQDEEVVSALAEFMQVPDEVISGGGLYAFDPELVVNAETLTGMQEMFMEVEGVLTYEELIPAEDLVDDEIRREAVGG